MECNSLAVKGTATSANEKDSGDLSFRKWRRRVIDQIMIREQLSPTERVIGYVIANLLNQHTRSTSSSSMTIGRKAGVTATEASDALAKLEKAGQVRTKKRDNGIRDTFLVLRDDIEPPDMQILATGDFFKTAAYRQFLSTRAMFLDQLFADKKISPTDKLIAFAASRFIKAEDNMIEESFKTIGSAVGYSWEATRKSIDRLVDAGYFDKRHVPGKKSILAPVISLPQMSAAIRDPGTDPGTDPGMPKSRNAHLTVVSSPPTVDSVDSVKVTDQREGILDSDSLYWARGKRTRTLDAAHGLWPDILTSFGVSPTALNGKHHPCPACGGKDRFRFTDRNGDGDYYCSGCDPGKGISLVAKVNGWSYAEAARRVDEMIGNRVKGRQAA
jgi:DNA-binding MarR family transcriptional regulator